MTKGQFFLREAQNPQARLNLNLRVFERMAAFAPAKLAFGSVFWLDRGKEKSDNP
jgi:hypothetical protein